MRQKLILIECPFPSAFQTEFRFDFRQSRIGHNTSTRQTKFTPNTECTVTRQRWFVSWFAHSLRHSILHGRWHWAARFSATWNNSFATHSIRFRSIVFTRVSHLILRFHFHFHWTNIQFNFTQTSQWRTHIGCSQSQQSLQQQFARRFIFEYIDARTQSNQFAVTTQSHEQWRRFVNTVPSR